MLSAKGTRRDKGDQDTRRPHCHATRLAWPRFAATTPLRSSPPTTPLITSPLNSNPPHHHHHHPSPLPFRSTCHPSITPFPSIHPPPSPGHPSATLPAHAVVCLLGNKLWLVYGGTLSSDTHTHTDTQTHTHTHTLQWIERPEKRHFGQRERKRGGREEGE